MNPHSLDSVNNALKTELSPPSFAINAIAQRISNALSEFNLNYRKENEYYVQAKYIVHMILTENNILATNLDAAMNAILNTEKFSLIKYISIPHSVLIMVTVGQMEEISVNICNMQTMSGRTFHLSAADITLFSENTNAGLAMRCRKFNEIQFILQKIELVSSAVWSSLPTHPEFSHRALVARRYKSLPSPGSVIAMMMKVTKTKDSEQLATACQKNAALQQQIKELRNRVSSLEDTVTTLQEEMANLRLQYSSPVSTGHFSPPSPSPVNASVNHPEEKKIKFMQTRSTSSRTPQTSLRMNPHTLDSVGNALKMELSSQSFDINAMARRIQDDLTIFKTSCAKETDYYAQAKFVINQLLAENYILADDTNLMMKAITDAKPFLRPYTSILYSVVIVVGAMIIEEQILFTLSNVRTLRCFSFYIPLADMAAFSQNTSVGILYMSKKLTEVQASLYTVLLSEMPLPEGSLIFPNGSQNVIQSAIQTEDSDGTGSLVGGGGITSPVSCTTPRKLSFPTNTAGPSSYERVIALYKYTAHTADELSFDKDDVIKMIAKEEPDWWKGELNGAVGLFPSNYVQPLWKSNIF